MSLEDPFFSVKKDVQQSLSNAQSLYSRWQGLLNDSSKAGGQECEWVANELRNGLKSIEWDLEDLTETISIVESNPSKFRLTPQEIDQRKAFIYGTRDDVKQMKEHLSSAQAKSKVEQSARKNLMGNSSGKKTKDRYTRLDNALEDDNQEFIESHQQQQQVEMERQDEQLEMVGQSVKVLRNMGEQIGGELETQNQMLDEFGDEIDQTQSKLDSTLMRMEKVLRLTNDKRQMCVIFALLVMLVVVVLLFALT
ncbi:syntaxin-6-like [Sycon ciliatum]|uniref:syntaxin-6-like n=1 Tax=Sycon ciliatum TaxID=27933 RepID=UPI0020AB59B6|eukprot:scpid90106/ scgid20242/ Syntaxin-6 &gt; Syntaxin-6